MSVAFRAPQRHRLSVQDYYGMAEAGILPREARLELIDGEIIDMAPIGSRHAGVVDLLAASLQRAVLEQAQVRVQSPVSFGDLNEPEPDIALLRPREDYYCNSHPTAEDVLLLVEVSGASLEYDRGTKLPLYARHGIRECWLIDLNTGNVVRHREPGAGGYERVDVITGSVALPGLADCALELPSIPT